MSNVDLIFANKKEPNIMLVLEALLPTVPKSIWTLKQHTSHWVVSQSIHSYLDLYSQCCENFFMGIMKLKTCWILKSLLRKIINVVIGLLTNAAHISISHSMKHLSLLIHFPFTNSPLIIHPMRTSWKKFAYTWMEFLGNFLKSPDTDSYYYTAHIKVQKFQAADKLLLLINGVRSSKV